MRQKMDKIKVLITVNRGVVTGATVAGIDPENISIYCRDMDTEGVDEDELTIIDEQEYLLGDVETMRDDDLMQKVENEMVV